MRTRGPAGGRGDRGDAGGVWIMTGWVAGLLVYAGVVLMAVAGFTAVLPLVVVPPVLLALIGGGNLLGGRTHGQASRASNRSGGEPPAAGPGVTGAAGEPGPTP